MQPVQLMIGFIILMGYPLIFLIIGRRFIFLIISVVEIFVFFSFLILRRCNSCPNFSCPFNGVKKEVVDSFLNKNPVMKKAWENEGWEKEMREEIKQVVQGFLNHVEYKDIKINKDIQDFLMEQANILMG